MTDLDLKLREQLLQNENDLLNLLPFALESKLYDKLWALLYRNLYLSLQQELDPFLLTEEEEEYFSSLPPR